MNRPSRSTPQKESYRSVDTERVSGGLPRTEDQGQEGEGFDHPYLSVVMVRSIFSNLGPFVQFIGRIMRAIEQDQPGHPLNQGVVVFHLGAKVARRCTTSVSLVEPTGNTSPNCFPKSRKFSSQRTSQNERPVSEEVYGQSKLSKNVASELLIWSQLAILKPQPSSRGWPKWVLA